jgi:hypothetical protein
MSRKHNQGKVEKALMEIATNKPEALEEWELMVKFNSPYSELQQFLKEQGFHNISVMNISNWWMRNRPRGKEAIALNTISESFKGIEDEDMNEMAVSLTAKIALMLFNSVNEEDIKKSSISTKVSNLIEALKELRINSGECSTRKTKVYSRQLKLEGALILAENLKQIFKETNFYEPLDKAINESLININLQ